MPLVCGSVLAVMDQHAADERVQLERLQAQVCPDLVSDLCFGPCDQILSTHLGLSEVPRSSSCP